VELLVIFQRGKESDMPLTEKGSEIMKSMKEQYGPEKGEQVFYASKNAGKITGVDAGLCGMDAIVAWGQPYGINVSEAGGPPASPELRKGIGI
jgi:hypothetical protein